MLERRFEKLKNVKPQFVDEIPSTKKHGDLYISKKYEIAVHLCACGCGVETVTPLHDRGPRTWKLEENGKKVTLSPSIGNQTFPCKSHYFIKNDIIEWVDYQDA